MAMAKTLRERNRDRSRGRRALRSSCPLVMAGGTTRKAGDKAAIGVPPVLCGHEGGSVARSGHVRRAGDHGAHLAASRRHGGRPRCGCMRSIRRRVRSTTFGRGTGELQARHNGEADGQEVKPGQAASAPGLRAGGRSRSFRQAATRTRLRPRAWLHKAPRLPCGTGRKDPRPQAGRRRRSWRRSCRRFRVCPEDLPG